MTLDDALNKEFEFMNFVSPTIKLNVVFVNTTVEKIIRN